MMVRGWLVVVAAVALVGCSAAPVVKREPLERLFAGVDPAMLRGRPERVDARDAARPGGVGETALAAEVDRRRAEVEQAPQDAQRRHRLALALMQAGEVEEAARQWEKAVELDPDFTKAYYNLGVCSYTLGLIDDAETHWLKAVELEPTHVSGHYNLGVLKHSAQALEEAADHYRQCIALAPQNRHLKAQVNLGLALAGQKEFDRAREVWERLLSQNPQCFNACYNLGVLSQQRGEVVAAVRFWQRAADISLDEVAREMGDESAGRRIKALAYYNLGVAADEAGDLGKAIAYFRQAFELDSTNPLIRQAWRSAVRQERLGY